MREHQGVKPRRAGERRQFAQTLQDPEVDKLQRRMAANMSAGRVATFCWPCLPSMCLSTGAERGEALAAWLKRVKHRTHRNSRRVHMDGAQSGRRSRLEYISDLECGCGGNHMPAIRPSPLASCPTTDL